VVPGDQRQDVVRGHPASSGVDAGTLPLLGLHRLEGGDIFLATPTERGERLRGVIAQVLTLFGPAVRWAEARQPRFVVRREDRETPGEQLLGVAEMAQHF